VVLCATVPLLALAPSYAALVAALAVFGVADALTDVAMNERAVGVEARAARPLLSGFHALWTLGALVGSATGAVAAGAGVPPARHLAVTGAVLALVAAGAGVRLPDDLTVNPDRPAVAPWTAARTIGLLGVLALLAAATEGAAGDWSAVYLRDEVGLTAGRAGAGFTVFAVAMLGGRLAGDAITARVGPVRMLRGSSLVAAGGLLVVLVVPTVEPAGIPADVTLAGFAVFGLGTAAFFPLIFSAAGRRRGVAAASAIAMMSVLARGGFLLGPLLVGGVAEVAGLRTGLGIAVVAALGTALLAGRGLAQTR
jgi:hypothetical protein